jgi:hypothetical protein
MAERIQELQVETDARLSWASFHPFRWSIDRVPLVGTGPKERGLTDLLWPYRNLAISQSTSLYSNVKWSNRRIELGFNGCGSNKIMGSLQVLAKTARPLAVRIFHQDISKQVVAVPTNPLG